MTQKRPRIRWTLDVALLLLATLLLLGDWNWFRPLLERACKLLTQGDEPPALAEVAAKLKLSPSALTRLFQRELGLSPRDYLAQAKRERFRSALRNGEDIAAATFGAGYGSSSRVYEGERAGRRPGDVRAVRALGCGARGGIALATRLSSAT